MHRCREPKALALPVLTVTFGLEIPVHAEHKALILERRIFKRGIEIDIRPGRVGGTQRGIEGGERTELIAKMPTKFLRPAFGHLVLALPLLGEGDLIGESGTRIGRNERAHAVPHPAAVGVLLFNRHVVKRRRVRGRKLGGNRSVRAVKIVFLAHLNRLKVVGAADVKHIQLVEAGFADDSYVVALPSLHIRPGVRPDKEQFLSVHLKAAVLHLRPHPFWVLDGDDRLHFPCCEKLLSFGKFALEFQEIIGVLVDAVVHIIAVGVINLALAMRNVKPILRLQIATHKVGEIRRHRLERRSVFIIRR